MNKRIIVNKFGGGILKKDLIPMMVERLQEQIKAGQKPVVVVSALPGVTDELLSPKLSIKNLKAKHAQAMKDIGLSNEWQAKAQIELNKLFIELERARSKQSPMSNGLAEPVKSIRRGDPRTLRRGALVASGDDKIVSFGEKLSATIFAYYLNSLGLPAKRILAEEIPIMTDDTFKNANIIFKVSEKNVQKKLAKLKEIPVIPGFTGKTKSGKTTTLGRGGTDTTACFIGASLRAEKVILWKDVGGVLSADPKIVAQAKTIPFISYQEAEEAGKIIHDKAIQYIKLYGTGIEIASLANPKQKTVVGPERNQKRGAKLVSYKKDLTLFLITDEVIKGNELLSIVSQIFVQNKVDVLLISNTRYSLQIVAEANGLSEKILKEINKKVHEVEAHKVNMVFLVGNFDVQYVNDFNSLLIKMKTDMEISAFLYKNCTRLEAVIKTNKVESVVKALYNKFIK